MVKMTKLCVRLWVCVVKSVGDFTDPCHCACGELSPHLIMLRFWLVYNLVPNRLPHLLLFSKIAHLIMLQFWLVYNLIPNRLQHLWLFSKIACVSFFFQFTAKLFLVSTNYWSHQKLVWKVNVCECSANFSTRDLFSLNFLR